MPTHINIYRKERSTNRNGETAKMKKKKKKKKRQNTER